MIPQGDLIYLILALLCLPAGYFSQHLLWKNLFQKLISGKRLKVLLPTKQLIGPLISLLLVTIMLLVLTAFPQYDVSTLMKRLGFVMPLCWLVFLLLRIFAESKIILWCAFLVSACWIIVTVLGFYSEFKASLSGPELAFQESSLNLYQAMLIVSILLIVHVVLNSALKIWLNQAFDQMAERRKISIRRRICFVIYMIIAILVLNMAGVGGAFLSFLTGGLGIGIGFSLKQVTANFISGRIIHLSTLMKEGDMCHFEDGSRAIVEGISATHVRMISLTGVSVLVPCGEFMDNKFKIWRKGRDNLMVMVEFDLTYRSNVAKAMDIVLDKGPTYKSILKDPKPSVTIARTAESSIVVRLVYWMNDFPGGTWRSKSMVYENVIREFALHQDIEFAYPTRTLFMEDSEAKPLTT